MIVEPLYKKVAALDKVRDRSLKMRHPFYDYSRAQGMNAMFAAVVEFADICREYPIVFVRAGKDESTGEDFFAPMAVLGLQQGENLYLLPNGHWRTPYVPALLRCYPFGMAQVGSGQLAMCVDHDWDGLSQTEGDPLFTEEGEPTQLTKSAMEFVENYENEVMRTRAFCSLLAKEGLLTDMRFDATLPGGETLGVDGFLAIDEAKLKELPDAKIVELHRNGVMAMIHAQQVSMGLMRRLVEWHAERTAAKQ